MTALRRGALFAALLLVGCSSTAGVGSPTTTGPTVAPVVVGETSYPAGDRPTIPDLSGTTLAGGTVSLHSLLGQVVVLNAWASWCDPCRQESPDLARVAEAMGPAGVRFVGLDEQDVTSHAIAFAKQVGATYPELVDADGSLLLSLKIVPPAAIPSTLVLDRTGRVAARFIGATTAAKLMAVLREILAQK